MKVFKSEIFDVLFRENKETSIFFKLKTYFKENINKIVYQ
jgi:hypothetical protein